MNRQAEPRSTLPPPSVSLTLFVSLTLIASLLGLFVRGDRHMWGDIAMLEAIQAVDLPGVQALVTLSNLVFGTGGALVLGLIFIGTALVLHRPELVQQMVVVVCLRLVGQVWKPIFDSPRPGTEFQPDPSLVSSTLGYPSGHSYTAAIVASMLIIFVQSLEFSEKARRITTVVAVLLTALALFSRIHIGAHWPSDTIGGVMYGVATVALMQLVVRFISSRGDASEPMQSRSPFPR